jgi:Mrp family chromosome partitioning ATPase
VILDTPSLVPVPDCRVVEPWVDGFLVVVAAHRTPRNLLDEALRVLPASKMLGLVFNMDDMETRRYYPYLPHAVSGNGHEASRRRWRFPWRTESSHEW